MSVSSMPEHAQRVPRHLPAPTSRKGLFGGSLSELLHRHQVGLRELETEDPEFFGGVVEHGSAVTVVVPAGQAPEVRDAIVRALLGRLWHIELSPLPAVLGMTEWRRAA